MLGASAYGACGGKNSGARGNATGGSSGTGAGTGGAAAAGSGGQGATLCGSCAGTCVGQRCLVALATGQSPVAISVGESRVHWLDIGSGSPNVKDDAVKSVPADGGSIRTLAAHQLRPDLMAVDATGVYWTGAFDGSVNSVPVGGGTPQVLVSGLTGALASGIAVRGGAV